MGDAASLPSDSVACCGDDRCKKIRDEIDERINRNKHDTSVAPDGKGIHGLSHQFRELKSHIERGSFDRAQTHINEIHGNQGKLKKLLDDLKKNGCGDPPPGAWTWATRPTKEYQDAVDAQKGSTLGTVGKAALGAGALYAGYRIVRFLPSLAPPLWWTAPANFAVP